MILLFFAIFVLLLPQVSTFTPNPNLLHHVCTTRRTRRTTTSPKFLTSLHSIAPKDFKTGLTIIMPDKTPVKIISFQHTKVARGVASTKARLKNLLNDSVINKVIQSNDKFEVADMGKKPGIFSYADDSSDILHFMDSSTCEEILIQKNLLAEKGKWLYPGMSITLVTFNEKVVDVLLPPSANYEVLDTPPSRATSDGKSVKLAELDCGGSITVPSFVAKGDKVSVNLETYTYQSRAKG